MQTTTSTAQGARRTARFSPTLDHVWIASALMPMALRPLLTPVPPHDFWWHIATGRIIVTPGAIPAVDSFFFTRGGAPFFNQGWLAIVSMYGMYLVVGVPLMILFQTLV